MTATGDTPYDDRNHPETSRGFPATGTALAFGTIGASNAGSVKAKQSKLSPYHSSQLEAVVEATAICQKVGEACLAFSAKQLGLGMTQLARCQRSCINMLAFTSAMLTVGKHATADCRVSSDLVSVTAKACRECEAACREFEASPYKRCAESCRQTATACELLPDR